MTFTIASLAMTPVEAGIQDPQRKFWQLSVARKLELAFGLIALMTVGATLLSLVRFNDVDAVIHRLTDSSLPAVKLSLGVEARTNELAIMGAELGNVSDTTQMLDLITKVGEESGVLWSTVGQLKILLGDSAGFSRMETLITAIDGDLQKFDRFTRERVPLVSIREGTAQDIRDGIGGIRRTLAGLTDPMTGATPTATGGEKAAAAASAPLSARPASLQAAFQLLANLGALELLLSDVATAATVDMLAPMHDRFDETWTRILAAIDVLGQDQSLDGTDVTRLRAAIRELRTLAVGTSGIFAVRDNELRAREASDQAQGALQSSAFEIRDQVAELVARSEAEAADTTALSASAIANSRAWLVAIAVASLIIAGLIVWELVLRYVVARLSDLCHAMLAIARGDLATPLPAAGHDELGDMSRALAVFRDNAREIHAAREAAERAHEEAEAASRAKSAFLANMSHELRTPLNAIIGYSEMLVEDATGRGDDASVSDLEKIQGAGKHLLGLINGILDLSKIEAGRMDIYLEQIYLAKLIDDVRSIVEPAAAKNGNRLVVDCPPDIGSIRSDITKLKQSLINLLSNAAKFTKQGKVQLSLSRSVGADGVSRVSFRVSDNGIGMTEEQIGRLFQAFTQADSSTTRHFGGTGLGLTITKHFSTMLGGTIEVTSKPGEGSTFDMILPDQPLATPAVTEPDSRATGSERGNGDGLTVLVADDDPTVHDMLTGTLIREGYRVLHANDGAEALDAIRRFAPDIVTLDVMMPKIDGWSVLGTMKSDPELSHIPVILITIVDDRNLGYSLGASEYMTKPIDRTRLVALVRQFTAKDASSPVLIVDDDPAVRHLVKVAVEGAGLEAAAAENGKAGLDWLSANPPPALILLDLMMPEMDGFEFLDKMRGNDAWQDVPVVVLTAKELTEAERGFLAQRTILVLSKSAQPITSLGAALSTIARRHVHDSDKTKRVEKV